MTYLEAVKLIKDIENKYDVMSIRFKGVSVWPFLRLYILDGISGQTEVKASRSIIKVVLRSLFAYNPFMIFKRHDVWLFTGCERRKRIGDKMIHRISGGISTSVEGCLMIEKPDLLKGHYKCHSIEEREIVSESWLLVLFHFLERVLRVTRPSLENEGVIQQVLNDYNLTFDYLHYVRMLNAKRLSLLFFLKIAPKPKLIMMECPYDSMGYVWASHQKGVKFLELQHGVAGRSHNAYNANFYERMMQPDGLCVFGSEEYKYFTVEEPQYAPKIYMTGLYMLERADAYFKNDVFCNERRKYDKIIVVSGQSGYEQQLALFIDKVADKNRDFLFVYIPRTADTALSFVSNNVKVERNVNIYEYLKWADVHVTISSTTCLEAQYFNTPTIFYDYDERASTYYGQLLKEENGALYVVDEKGFDSASAIVQSREFEYKEVFVHGHEGRMLKVISEQLGN